MRQVRDVLRLRAAGISGNEIARRVGVAPSTVRLTLKRLAAAGLRCPLPAETTDAALEAQLFTAVGTKQGHRRRAEPDWAAVQYPIQDTEPWFRRCARPKPPRKTSPKETKPRSQ